MHDKTMSIMRSIRERYSPIFNLVANDFQVKRKKNSRTLPILAAPLFLTFFLAQSSLDNLFLYSLFLSFL